MYFDYQKICEDLIKDLPQRTQSILERRFGLVGKTPETLEAIGQNYGITRERVRQIERDGLNRLKPKVNQYVKVFNHLENLLKQNGDLQKEDSYLVRAAGQGCKNSVLFLLTLGEKFERLKEDDYFHCLWTCKRDSVKNAKEVVETLVKKFKKTNSPLGAKEICVVCQKQARINKDLNQKVVSSYVEVCKKINQGPGNVFGLESWPEINPRGIKDKIYVVLKQNNKPLHFGEIACLVDGLDKNNGKRALVRTVHNELIKDERFVLVGRGTYALTDWGYKQGQVKDVISQVLKESKSALSKQEIIKRVLKQRLVKPNTILLNLNNGGNFTKDTNGRYKLA